MRRYVLAAIAALVVGGMAATVRAADAIPDYVSAAVADAGRPQADKDRDVDRKPAEVLVFAQVKPGARVLELIPGGGYFSRLLSKVVGPGGHLYAALPPQANAAADARHTSNGVAADPNFGNVSEIELTPADIAKLGPVDMIWTSQNYHDLHLARLHVDVAALDRLLFAALKPGGVLIIEDHAAEPGSGARDVDALHRIDEAFVKQEVESAGFRLDGESDVLRNSADTHKVVVFDASIRGHTDQFVLRFRKPK